jgi:4a-hydroxytetrahydrobiopterin dehydratase
VKHLKERSCRRCEGADVPYTAQQARSLMGQLHEGWQVSADGKAIRRELRFQDFYHTMGFVNALAHVANAEDHHPDLEVGYNYCNVRFSTHDAGGLTEKDFICAAKTDALA